MITGTSLLLLKRWQMAIPSVPGSMTSKITRSKGCGGRRHSKAPSPSETARVSNPSSVRAICKMSRTAASSSTTRTLGIRARLEQLDRDGGPGALAGTDGDTAPHPLGKLPADRKPQAEAFGIVAPVEALENVGQIPLAYACATVFHDGGCAYRPYRYTLATPGVFDGVAEQDEHQFLKPLGVRVHFGPLALRPKLEPRARRQRLHAGNRLPHRTAQIHAPHVGFARIPSHAGQS